VCGVIAIILFFLIFMPPVGIFLAIVLAVVACAKFLFK
jgi:hypothetical protein